MEYTMKERLLIEDVALVASVRIGKAYELMSDFYETYFGCTDELEYDLKHRRELVEAKVYSILEWIRQTKIELDVYMDPDSHEMNGLLLEADRKREIVKALAIPVKPAESA